ncbi:MAG: DUF3467 domain-containing protein [Patescibacteria group bacterium]|nr:DUF3467 domain-containing protein [Patescibacteria group bacterium]
MDKDNKENKKISIPVIGEYANWAGVNNSELQTIIDFGFIQPSKEGEAKTGVMLKRIILPPSVAKDLGKILVKVSKKNEKSKKTTKN